MSNLDQELRQLKTEIENLRDGITLQEMLKRQTMTCSQVALLKEVLEELQETKSELYQIKKDRASLSRSNQSLRDQNQRLQRYEKVPEFGPA